MSGLRSVRVRILASILVVAALGMAIAGGTAFLVQRDRTLREIDTKLTATVTGLQYIADGGDGTADPPPTVQDFLTLAMTRVLPDTNESIVGIVDGKAALIPSSNVSFHLEADADFMKRVVAEANATKVVMGTADSKVGTLRYVIIPISIKTDATTGLYVSAYNLDAELAQITNAFATYAVVAVAALVAIGLVGWFVAGRLLRPIRVLRDTAARITETDLTQRIAVVGTDDVSELAETVNDMLDRLEAAFTSQRQLLDDVGHELKTPITIVRGHLELLDADQPEEVRATRELTIDELDRMNSLVTDIALLAQTRNPDFVSTTIVDVVELTESVMAKASALSLDHEWQLAQAAELTAAVDPARITQAWLQLAENAVKYSPPGSAIVIGSTVALDNQVDLWVRDRGRGIRPEHLERIFRRFARAEEGRGVDGSGLGLSIVAAIARAHGGRAFAESTPGVGSLFVIRLPRGSTTIEN
jgi:two-component system, OmpR family, sensor kinase